MPLSTRQPHHRTAGNTRKFSHVQIPISPNAIELEPEHSSDVLSCDYTELRRRPGNSWTLEQRQALCVLRRWYENSWAELAKVFNIHFASHSPAGFCNLEVSGSGLAMQLCNMRLLGIKREAFVSVFVETLFVDEFCTWASMKGDLERSAERAGIALRRRLLENREEMLQKCSQPKKGTKRKKTMSGIDSVLGNLTYESEEDDGIPETPKNQQKFFTPSPTPQKVLHALTRVGWGQCDSVAAKNTQCGHIPATPQSLGQLSEAGPSPLNRAPQEEMDMEFCGVPSDDDGQYLGTGEQLPRTEIVFRFYDDRSSGVNRPTGIRAGLFENIRAEITPPPDLNSKSFRKEAIKHFSWSMEPTPFISMYESLLPVLHRGLQSAANASVAIINLHTITKSQRYNGSKLYLAAQIINQLSLRRETFGYRGISEWVVWGVIDQDAIVATFKIEHLRELMYGAPDVRIVLRFSEIESAENANEYNTKLLGNVNHVSKASGRVVGKFLAFIAMPHPYVESAAKKMARDWQLVGNKSKPRLRRYLEGVHLGLREAEADSRSPTEARVKLRLTEYLKQVDLGLHRSGVENVRSKQARPKRRMAAYLRQVDSGLRRRAANDVPSEHARAKPRMIEYLRRVDTGSGRKRVELRSSTAGQGISRPRLAAYLRKLDLGQAHAKTASRDECVPSGPALESDNFLLRRRHIEAVCQGH